MNKSNNTFNTENKMTLDMLEEKKKFHLEDKPMTMYMILNFKWKDTFTEILLSFFPKHLKKVWHLFHSTNNTRI